MVWLGSLPAPAPDTAIDILTALTVTTLDGVPGCSPSKRKKIRRRQRRRRDDVYTMQKRLYEVLNLAILVPFCGVFLCRTTASVRQEESGVNDVQKEREREMEIHREGERERERAASQETGHGYEYSIPLSKD